jgi:hypothetical protein
VCGAGTRARGGRPTPRTRTSLNDHEPAVRKSPKVVVLVSEDELEDGPVVCQGDVRAKTVAESSGGTRIRVITAPNGPNGGSRVRALGIERSHEAHRSRSRYKGIPTDLESHATSQPIKRGSRAVAKIDRPHMGAHSPQRITHGRSSGQARRQVGASPARSRRRRDGSCSGPRES